VRELVRFLRANPQAAILLAICIVLGLGTLVALLISTATSGSGSGGGVGVDGGMLAPLRVLAGLALT
jgi:hypothetical protein